MSALQAGLCHHWTLYTCCRHFGSSAGVPPSVLRPGSSHLLYTLQPVCQSRFSFLNKYMVITTLDQIHIPHNNFRVLNYYLQSYCPGPASKWSFSVAHMVGFQYLEINVKMKDKWMHHSSYLVKIQLVSLGVIILDHAVLDVFNNIKSNHMYMSIWPKSPNAAPACSL